MDRQEARKLPKGRRVGPDDFQNAMGICPSTSTLSWYFQPAFRLPMDSLSIHHTASRIFCDALSGLPAKAWAETLAGKARAFAKVLAKVLAEALAK